MEYDLGYREVVPGKNPQDKWQEIVLTTGGSQSTLQDIKVPERAGGYSYKNACDTATRNRFICWRIIHDVLELSEHSLDINLANNRVKYKFTDTPVLDSISVHETDSMVLILVATVSSIHKLSFPHPVSVQKQVSATGIDCTVPSIFSELSTKNTRDPHSSYVIPTAGLTSSPVAHAAASWLVMPQEEALFAFAFNSGSILLLRLNTVTGSIQSNELKIESLVPRFLSGIATALRGKASEAEIMMSIVMHTYEDEVYLFTFCREGQLRMWSCNKIQCISVIDVFTNESSLEIIQHHTLRKMTNSNDALYLCTYMEFDTRCEFSIFKLLKDSRHYLNRVCTLLSPKQHLIDFSYTTTRLWALWRLPDADTVAMTHIRLPSSNTNCNCQWESVVLAEAPDKDYVINDLEIDPRQAYLDFIFYPGQFAFVDIIKALNIYQKSNLAADVKLSPSELKEKICIAIETEIQAEVIDYELMDEDYLEIVNRCWSKFYSCLLQYHMNRHRPVGFLLLPTIYGVVLMKKYSFSFLRPMELLEYLNLCHPKLSISLLKKVPALHQNENKCQDILELMLLLTFLEDNLSDDFKSTFEKELYRSRTPNSIIERLFTSNMANCNEKFSDFDFQSELHRRLENVKDLSNSIEILLEMITHTFDGSIQSETNQSVSRMQQLHSNVNNFFGSQLGVSVICKIVTQITRIRFNVCRNLLILQQIVIGRQKSFNSLAIHNIQLSLATRTVIITQAYYMLLWICKCHAPIATSQRLLDTSAQRLALLSSVNSRMNIEKHSNKSFSLLETFVHRGARQYMNKFLEQIEKNLSNFHIWHLGLFSYTNYILQLMWPITENFLFPEWLLASCQFLVIQEYVRLLGTWCACNSASRKFILAISLLEMGEPHKSSDYFSRASNGVVVDRYMSTLFWSKNYSKSEAIIMYYLKVIELFEHHNAQDIVVDLAMTAITIANRDNSNLPTLHSIVFAQHLNLQHHIEAYNYLNTNPDAARRIDCLRQLVVALFSRKKLKDLVSFPYIDMYQDLEKIMEARARSVDLMENNYYDFLYSFHINKGNMRKAASVMYEQALRLSQEPHSFSIVYKQANCLLACINALSLVNKKYRWIVRPVIDYSCIENNSSLQKKRNLNGHRISKFNINERVEVLELQDIKMEYALTSAKLKLIKIEIEGHNISHTCPSEIIALLSNCGLHLRALNICKYFKQSKVSVLENLASQCARLNHEEQLRKWDWLKVHIVDYNFSNLSPANVSWRLLKNLISQYEEIGKSELHKTVTKQLLHHNIFLPEWLYSSYAKRNAPELLRLLIQMGRLKEAARFSVKYIQALLGKGKEYFELEVSLSINALPAYFPSNYLEILLFELKYACENDRSYLPVLKLLKNEYGIYLKSLENVSVNMILMKTNAKKDK